jgi:hypothetical protein
MKKIGFVGVAEATTLIGDVRVTFADGLETVSGKSLDPLPQPASSGATAVGAGSGLVEGDHVIGTGGVEGYVGDDGLGVGVGVGVGEMTGLGAESVPHEVRIPLAIKRPKANQRAASFADLDRRLFWAPRRQARHGVQHIQETSRYAKQSARDNSIWSGQELVV